MYIIPTMGMGGAETMVRDYCLLLNDRYNIHLVVIDGRVNSVNEEVIDNNEIKVTYLNDIIYPGLKNIGGIKRLTRAVVRYVYFLYILLSGRPDVIHGHLVVGKYMKFASMVVPKAKLVMTIHNVIPHYFDKSGEGIKYKEYSTVDELIHQRNMKLLALHDSLAEELRLFFDTQNVGTVNNGIALEKFIKCDITRTEARRRLEIKEEDFVIGNIGSLQLQKNHDLIINVFEHVVYNKGINAKLLLIGKGDLKSTIVNELTTKGLMDRTIMLENREDIPELVKAMDVFLFPSRWEGFGNVMIEAQSMGTYCVTSNMIPSEAIINDNVVVCNLEDSLETWAEAVINPRYETGNHSDRIKKYDIRAVVDRLSEVYEGMGGL